MAIPAHIQAVIDAEPFEVYRFKGQVHHRVKPHVRELPGGLLLDQLDCQTADALERLPADLRVSGLIILGDVMIDACDVWFTEILPETVQAQMVGRRFGDVVSHRLFRRHPIEDAIIQSVESGKLDAMVVTLDRSPFQPKAA